MLFDFNQSKDLLTPTIGYGGVNKINPILTSSDIFQPDENDVSFSVIKPEKNENIFSSKYDPDDYQQQQDDLFSSFDLPALAELEKSEFSNDGFQIDKYIADSSFPSPAMDVHNPSISDDSTFFPLDESTTSSAFPWVGEECTVESKMTEDMMVPPSPSSSSSSVSGSHLISRQKSTKKTSLSTIERKLRKKDQNKTAAEKYRLKKRSERDEIMTRHSNLQNQNRELKYEYENLTYRLEQLKQLFVDVLQIEIPSTKSN